MPTFVATVRDLSHKGLGVVDHPDGRTFFVRGTWPGDEAEFEASEDSRKYEEAKLVRMIMPSPSRVEIACSFRGFLPGQCGGCPWMMADYSSQLKLKRKRLIYALEKRQVLHEVTIPCVIPSPNVFGYRNRVQLKTDGVRMGYVSEGSTVFGPVDDCLIMNEKLRNLFHELKAKLPREDWRPTGGHQWSYLDLDDEATSKDVYLNKRRPFRQGNTEQNEVMRSWIRDKFSNIPFHYPVIDLFCGSGNFTQVLSGLGFTNILAVEVQGAALEALRQSGLPGVRILPLDMSKRGVWASIARFQPHAKALLLDPPREGLEKRRGLYKYLDNLEIIFYISCEIDTFSRDAADLIKHGWKLQEMTPIDLFPHTPHVEVLSVFTRL